MFDRILVGLDGSPRESLVIKRATDLALAHRAELHLCRAVMVPLSVPAAAWTLSGEDLSGLLIQHAAAAVAERTRELPDALTVHTHVRIGQPADLLCEVADEIGADLLVIGSHGYDRIDRLLGTTAAKVVNRAHCSVLVVRPRA